MSNGKSGNNNPINIDSHASQFQYLGRWVEKSSFRAFVYNAKGEECLAGSYKEFEDLISSGVWFADKDKLKAEVVKDSTVVAPKKGKLKDDLILSTG